MPLKHLPSGVMSFDTYYRRNRGSAIVPNGIVNAASSQQAARIVSKNTRMKLIGVKPEESNVGIQWIEFEQIPS